MRIRESGEMYLETIYVLSKTKPVVRSIDVAESLGFSRPSVSRAVKVLEERGYVATFDKTKLSLTEAGREIAENLYERHRVLTEFLTEVGVEQKQAETDACRIEHVISADGFEAIKAFTNRNKRKKI